MLTKLKELGRDKCFQYWPKPGHSERHNYLLVEPVQEYSMTQFVIREFRICDAREGMPRRVRQFHFDWPEQGVPKQSQAFVDFIRYVDEAQRTSQPQFQGPVLVHCSSGSARTGVFVALKIVLDRMDCEGFVDVFQTVKLLRTQRPAMVQTEVCMNPVVNIWGIQRKQDICSCCVSGPVRVHLSNSFGPFPSFGCLRLLHEQPLLTNGKAAPKDATRTVPSSPLGFPHQLQIIFSG